MLDVNFFESFASGNRRRHSYVVTARSRSRKTINYRTPSRKRTACSARRSSGTRLGVLLRQVQARFAGHHLSAVS